MELWRLFIAIELPQITRDRLAELISDMRKAAQFTAAQPAWARADASHLTLQFLGDTAEERVPALAAALDRAAAGIVPFEIALRGVGGFPNLKRPRVLWLGVADGEAGLQASHRAVIRETQALGIIPEDRPFAPHLTLARIKSSKAIELLMQRLRRFTSKSAGKFLAEEITLFRSELHPDGARYTALHRAKMQSAR